MRMSDEATRMPLDESVPPFEQNGFEQNQPGQESRFRAFCRRNHWGLGPVRVILILLVLVLVLLSVLLFGNGNQARYSSRSIDFGLRDMGELATQAGYYTNVNTITKPDRTIAGIPIPGTSSRAIMTYQGVIRAGLDFEQIRVSLDRLGKTVTLQMPPVRILSNEIDLESCEVYDEQNSIFNKIDVSNYNASLSDMKSRAESQAKENGILEAAMTNAEALIRGMIKGAEGMEEYTLRFHWPDVEGGNP